VTAIRTLTCIPIPGKDAESFARSLPWFSLVGVLLGVLQYLMVYALSSLSETLWVEGTGAILLVSGVLLTRGLHLDGISDWADAFWGIHDREKTLSIMKDSFLGTYGVIALILTLLIKWTCYVELIRSDQIIWIIPACLISRTMQVDLAVWFPYARKEGTASSFVEGATFRDWIINLVLAAGFLFYMLDIAGIFALFLGWIVVRLLAFWSVKRIGGITGDILGTGNELVEVAVLIFPLIL
ncbi:MAG: adenosylcobinamide-GDP ribazoletransferase, partial [Proteobacteria bacterium]|nr:adenosylcobinamide-GDP ribazoletransferase [Pseudomonadota bacterium]